MCPDPRSRLLSKPLVWPSFWGLLHTIHTQSLLLFWSISSERVWCKGVTETYPRVLNTPSVEPLEGLAHGRTCLPVSHLSLSLPLVCARLNSGTCFPWQVTGFAGSQLSPACWDEEVAFWFCFTLMTSRFAPAKSEKVQTGQGRLCKSTGAGRLWHS